MLKIGFQLNPYRHDMGTAVFCIDIETCRTCGRVVRNIACSEDAVVIEKILAHLNKKDTSRVPPCRASPQSSLFD